MWLPFANLLWPNQPQTLHAVVFAFFLQRLEIRFFMRVRRHHKLPRVAKRNTMLFAKFVRQPVSFNAVPRLQRILRIVDAGMHDPAVTRTGGHPQLRILLHQKNIIPTRRNRPRDRTSNDASTNNQNVRLVHGPILSAHIIHAY